jgi:hypothetical protein
MLVQTHMQPFWLLAMQMVPTGGHRATVHMPPLLNHSHTGMGHDPNLWYVYSMHESQPANTREAGKPPCKVLSILALNPHMMTLATVIA